MMVMVVTSAYRLNIFGFFTTRDHVAPGNYGLLDQVAALEWIAAKISLFGGDPETVVISGHSSGGIGVGLHLVSPLSHGKFVRAIIMSAKGLMARTVKSPSKISMYISQVADRFGCELKSSRLIECLRKVDGNYLLQNAHHLVDAFGPIIDKDYANDSRPFLPDDPLELIKNEQFAKVPLLVGYTGMEEALEFLEANENAHNGVSWEEFTMAMTDSVVMDLSDFHMNDTCFEDLAVSHLTDTLLFYYTPRPLTNDMTVLRGKLIDFSTEKYFGSGAYLLANALSQANINVYLYRFDYKIKTDSFIRYPKNESHLANWINAPHQFDLPFVWGVPYWTHLLRNITWNSADKKMSDTLLALWGNFVKFGNPTHSGVHLKWDVFRDNISGVMILDRNSNMSDMTNFDYKAFEFWNDYYPKVWNVILQSCNMTSNSMPSRTVSVEHLFLFGILYVCTAVFKFL